MSNRFTIRQLSSHLNVSERTVQRWARVYRWPVVKLGRVRLFDWAEVEAHMKRQGIRIV